MANRAGKTADSGGTRSAERTLQEHAAAYLEHLRSRNYSPGSIREERYALRRFLRWLERTFGITTPERLSRKHLQGWLPYLCSLTTRKGYPLKPSTINKDTTFVRGFLSYLSVRGYIHRALVEVLQRVKEPRTLPGSVMTHAQIRRLLDRMETNTPEAHRDRTILELLYTSGIRARELVGLDVADVDLDRGTALVHGKGGKDRVVPIGATARRFLKSYVVAVRPSLLRNRTETALFLNHLGKRFGYASLRRTICVLRRAMGLGDNVTAHTFRRSCTTELIRSGANVYHVKELLGHESLRTLKPYTRLTIIDLKRTHRKCHPRERDEAGE